MKKKIAAFLIITAAVLGCACYTNSNKPAMGKVGLKFETVEVEANELPEETMESIPEEFETVYNTVSETEIIEEEPAEITYEEAKESQAVFFENMEGGLFERLTNAVSFLPEGMKDIYKIGEITFTEKYKEGFIIRSQTNNNDGTFTIDLGIVKECENPEYYTLQSIASYAVYRTNFRPFETEEFLYAWEKEHESDFFEDDYTVSPQREFEKYFASICLKDPAYEYNKIHAPLTTAYVEDYIENFDLYCNMNATRHECKHEDRKYCSLEMRLNWVKVDLPEAVREAMERENLEFNIIDRSQELVDLTGCEFMGLYCPIGSLGSTSYGWNDHPIIFLIKGYENYFEDTARHEIGHFVCNYTSYKVWDVMSGYLSENEDKISYFSYDTEFVQENVGEYFANAFAYYYCDQCEISEYWEELCPVLNEILTESVSNLNNPINTASEVIPDGE